jgi:hypothetical protein
MRPLVFPCLLHALQLDGDEPVDDDYDSLAPNLPSQACNLQHN